MVVIVGDLDCELATGAQHPGEVRERGVMIGQPVEGGVGEHEVVARAGVEAGDVLQGEAQAGRLEDRGGQRGRGLSLRTGVGEHGRRAVEAESRTGPQALVEQLGELAGAAAEVDDVQVGLRLDEGEQVMEGLGALGLELLVGGGLPAHGGMRTQGRGGWQASCAATAAPTSGPHGESAA